MTEPTDTPDTDRRTLMQAAIGAPLLVAAAARPGAAQPVGQTVHSNVFVKHAYEERTVNLGEITMNYVTEGSPSKPALLLIPGQTESWWAYEKAIGLLAPDFQVFAVDLRGQGRTTWTPERYTFDNMGGDLVRFISLVIKRPVITSGCSSGGVLSCWLSAYAMPGQLRASHYEDPPLFSSEFNPLYGQSIRQAAGPLFEGMALYLGDQWSIGDWAGLQAARSKRDGMAMPGGAKTSEPPQNLKEYDPEWARAFYTGAVAQSCPHQRMLAQVKVPVLFTHHFRRIDPSTGHLIGAISDLQVTKARELIAAAGQPFEYVDLPTAAHTMHQADPALFAKVLGDWAKGLKA
jgi:pimeloyl-ACP methyl ester carboxylesterase